MILILVSRIKIIILESRRKWDIKFEENLKSEKNWKREGFEQAASGFLDRQKSITGSNVYIKRKSFIARVANRALTFSIFRRPDNSFKLTRELGTPGQMQNSL